MKNKNKGFTLVEIMIVVVIIGLLASMAIPAFQKVRTNSQDKAVLNNARQLSAASDQYYLENGVSSVILSDLLGPTSYIKALNSVANEIVSRGLLTGHHDYDHWRRRIPHHHVLPIISRFSRFSSGFNICISMR
jgi:type IV pilus assembly protein PilA